MDISQILLLIFGTFCIYLLYKWGVSTSQPKEEIKIVVETQLDIQLNDEKDKFSGKILFKNGDICTLSGTIVGENIFIKTDNNLIYEYYSGKELENILKVYFMLNKKIPAKTIVVDKNGDIIK